MDIEITNYNNFFKIKGNLNKKNLSVFKNEFEDIFETVETLTISVEDIESMDSYGVNAIGELHKESIAKNKKLAIIGFGCADLFNHFKSEVVAA